MEKPVKPLKFFRFCAIIEGNKFYVFSEIEENEEKSMKGIDKILTETAEKLGIRFVFCRKSVECTEEFREKYEDSDKHTAFRFFFRGEEYFCVMHGKGKTESNYAALLPSYIEAFSVSSGELTKTEFLKRIVLGECTSADIYKYMLKYAVKSSPCFAIALRGEKMPEDAVALAMQYGGNAADTVVRLDEQNCVLVKFLGEEENEYSSATDYAEFLAQSLKEELGIAVAIGVGGYVKSLKDIAESYQQAASALRYADVFSSGGGVHSYKEYLLVRMLEEVSEGKLTEYLREMTDEKSKDIFDDEEMLTTAEEFLQNSLNVSETSRKLYMHRNTLLYRLDKIEKASGLNIRNFPEAVSFRVLTILYKLLKK